MIYQKPIIALIGSDGQLGKDLFSKLKESFQVIPLTISDIDITKLESINLCLKKINPQIVVSTAGYSNVPECERKPYDAFSVNTIGTKFLTDWCYFNNAKLVFFSSDYVFNGKKRTPYTEKDTPDPINTYGISKLAGECYIKNNLSDFIIARITGLYGHNKCLGKPNPNFVEFFINFIEGKDQVEFDGREICSPTYTPDIANQIEILLKKNISGLFHIVNEGYCSWFEFGQAIINELNKKVKLIHKQRSYHQFESRVPYQELKRPFFTALSNSNLSKMNLNKMRPWKEALHEYLLKRSK